jgi:DNA-binding NarL/FixJ family response regulator
MHAVTQFARRTISVGPSGYLTKGSAVDERVRAVRRLAHECSRRWG